MGTNQTLRTLVRKLTEDVQMRFYNLIEVGNVAFYLRLKLSSAELVQNNPGNGAFNEGCYCFKMGKGHS
jgi:hypothetical protein